MIGVFDSGIGGLTILKELKKILPNEDYLYYADKKNNPYGSKSTRELLKITKNIINYLLTNNCKVIVIACNTATTKCIKKLRKIYPNTIFIGTEPAIKLSCDNNFKKTLVMATPATIKSEELNKLIINNKKTDQEIILLPCNNLASAIEENNADKVSSILNRQLKMYQNDAIDSIILGCTHYPLIKNKIKTLFPNIPIIDGSVGVAKEVKHQLTINNLLTSNTTIGKTIYIDSRKL